MQEIFEKVIEELKQESIITDDDAGHRAIEIIRQTAAEYNNGWVPAEEPPKNSNYILLSFENFTVPLVADMKKIKTAEHIMSVTIRKVVLARI